MKAKKLKHNSKAVLEKNHRALHASKTKSPDELAALAEFADMLANGSLAVKKVGEEFDRLSDLPGPKLARAKARSAGVECACAAHQMVCAAKAVRECVNLAAEAGR